MYFKPKASWTTCGGSHGGLLSGRERGESGTEEAKSWDNENIKCGENAGEYGQCHGPRSDTLSKDLGRGRKAGEDLRLSHSLALSASAVC